MLYSKNSFSKFFIALVFMLMASISLSQSHKVEENNPLILKNEQDKHNNMGCAIADPVCNKFLENYFNDPSEENKKMLEYYLNSHFEKEKHSKPHFEKENYSKSHFEKKF